METVIGEEGGKAYSGCGRAEEGSEERRCEGVWSNKSRQYDLGHSHGSMDGE